MVFSMFTGCTEDDSMTEIQRPNQQPETVETDPVVKALAAIPGISDIKIEYGNTYDAVEIDAVLHQHVNHSCREQPAHCASLEYQSCLHLSLEMIV